MSEQPMDNEVQRRFNPNRRAREIANALIAEGFHPSTFVMRSNGIRFVVKTTGSACPQQFDIVGNNAVFYGHMRGGQFNVLFCPAGELGRGDPLVFSENIPVEHGGGEYGGSFASDRVRNLYLRSALAACDEWLANIKAGIPNPTRQTASGDSFWPPSIFERMSHQPLADDA